MTTKKSNVFQRIFFRNRKRLYFFFCAPDLILFHSFIHYIFIIPEKICKERVSERKFNLNLIRFFQSFFSHFTLTCVCMPIIIIIIKPEWERGRKLVIINWNDLSTKIKMPKNKIWSPKKKSIRKKNGKKKTLRKKLIWQLIRGPKKKFQRIFLFFLMKIIKKIPQKNEY